MANPALTSIIAFAGVQVTLLYIYSISVDDGFYHGTRAIELTSAILYGATVNQGQFCIYTSWWMEARIAISQMMTGGTLNLNYPIIILCRRFSPGRKYG
ncbi:hypothetical protein K439DRAFT_1067978 [Ramaria rubella]|nr:hypothetical protein K439DRAFT_1067978 [Ramaria rubella]